MERLFIYGTLQPGGPNEHVLAAIEGAWEPASVKGRLVEKGWGARMGYPGLVIDAGGNDVHGQVFSSSRLDAMWSHLDAFEGAEYERITSFVTLSSGARVRAHVYVLRADGIGK